MAYSEDIRLNELIPDSIFPAAENYVALLKKYYEYMNLEDNPSNLINLDTNQRDLETASKLFLSRIYQEIGESYFPNPDVESDTATVLSNLNVIYRAKGSLESINALFSIVFGEQVEYWLPKTLLFKTSQGDWQQDYSVTCDIISGDVIDLIGVFATVTTQLPGQPVQTFDVEINRIEILDDTKCRIYISRFSVNAFYEGSVITHKDVECRLTATTNIILNRVSDGEGFGRGVLYSLDSLPRNTVKDNLGIYSQGVSDRLGKYFNEAVSQRRYLEDGNRIDRYGIEVVTRNSYTDGLIIEDVIRDYATYRTIKYGNILTNVSYGSDGSRRVSRKTDDETNPAPNVKIDWDIIIEEMIKIADGVTGGTFEAFFNEDVGGRLRGNISVTDPVTNTITLDDVEILVRRLMGFPIKAEQFTWIQTNIETALLAIAYPQPTPNSNGSLKILPITLSETGGIATERLSVLGYDYPETFVSVIYPDETSDPAIYIMTSEFVARSSGYYNDVTGFTSDSSKIQDNDFYQDYSYVIKSGVTFDQFRNVIYKMTHPAGMKVFSEQLISQTIGITSDIDTLLAFIYNRLFYDLAFSVDNYDHFVMTKPRFDEAFSGDGIDQKTFTKQLQDIAESLEHSYEYTFTKILDETLLLDQIDDSKYIMTKAFIDQANASNINSYNLTKVILDIAHVDSEGLPLLFEVSKGFTDNVIVTDTGGVYTYSFYYDYQTEGLYVEDGLNSDIPGIGYVGLTAINPFNT